MTYDETFNRNRVTWLYRIARSPVSPMSVKVGLLFATFVVSDSREEVSPSYRWLMKTAGIGSRSTLAKCLRELEEHGFLEVVRAAGYRSCYALPFSGNEEWLPKSETGTSP